MADQTHPLKRLLSPLVIWRYEPWARTRFKSVLPVTMASGPSRFSDDHLRVAYAGIDPENRAYYFRRFIREPFQIETYTPRSIGSLPQFFRTLDNPPHFCFIEKGAFSGLFPFLHASFLLPYWIQTELSTAKSIQDMSKREKDGFTDVVRRIKKFNITHEITRDMDAFKDHWENYHLPFLKNRHDEEAFFVNFTRACKQFENGELMRIKMDGEIVAGNVLVHDGPRSYLRFIGVKDGNLDLMKYGILGASYYFPFEELHRRGRKILDVGGSSPFLNDGATKFKASVRARIIPNTYLPLRFLYGLIVRDTPAVRFALCQSPFIYYAGYFHPRRAIFTEQFDAGRREPVEASLQQRAIQGYEATDVFVFEKPDPAFANTFTAAHPGVRVSSLRDKILLQ